MPISSSHEPLPPTRPIKVLVVDDSALVRQLLKTIIDAQEGMQCIAVAKHADMALRMVQELSPDVMTLDIEMPGMSGLELLKILMHSHPLPVIMISSHTLDGAQTTLTALELGAVDFVTKPSIGVADGLRQHAQAVVEKIRTAAMARVSLPAHATTPHSSADPTGTSTIRPSAPVDTMARHASKSTAWHHLQQTGKQPSKPPPQRAATKDHYRPSTQLIAIGASTGGTDAIRTILQHMPADCPPIAIVQHMPAGFTRSFAERLNHLCAIGVHEAQDGQALQRGNAYIAPGGRHLRLQQTAGIAYVQLGDDEPVLRHRPSVDALFRSIRNNLSAPHCCCALLTGMGTDGAAAMLELHQAGAYTVAQSADTCVVYGMPREAAILGAASDILPLSQIAQALLQHAGG